MREVRETRDMIEGMREGSSEVGSARQCATCRSRRGMEGGGKWPVLAILGSGEGRRNRGRTTPMSATNKSPSNSSLCSRTLLLMPTPVRLLRPPPNLHSRRAGSTTATASPAFRRSSRCAQLARYTGLQGLRPWPAIFFVLVARLCYAENRRARRQGLGMHKSIYPTSLSIDQSLVLRHAASCTLVLDHSRKFRTPCDTQI